MVCKFFRSYAMQVLNAFEVQEVSGGIIPLALAVFYVAGGTAGVGAGWAIGRAFFCNK